MYEGRILGSNIGCISSYTLEVLILYLLITHSDEVSSPIDLFLKFFEYDWTEYVVTVFGVTKLEDARENPELLHKIHDISSSENGALSTLLKEHYELVMKHQKEFEQLNSSVNPCSVG